MSYDTIVSASYVKETPDGTHRAVAGKDKFSNWCMECSCGRLYIGAQDYNHAQSLAKTHVVENSLRAVS
jgi:hypothetical protein